MSKLVMTPGEILRSFKQAESKSKQVGILAELNATSREVIIDVLKEQGVHWRELTRAHSATSTDKKKDAAKAKAQPPVPAIPEASLAAPEISAVERNEVLLSALVCYRRQTELDLEKAIAQADSTMRRIDEVLRCIRSEV